MTTSGLCGQPIVHRHDDGSVTFTPCARKPGHQGRHRDADFLAREKDRVKAEYDALSDEERAERNRKRNRNRSNRKKLPAGTNSYRPGSRAIDCRGFFIYPVMRTSVSAYMPPFLAVPRWPERALDFLSADLAYGRSSQLAEVEQANRRSVLPDCPVDVFEDSVR